MIPTYLFCLWRLCCLVFIRWLLFGTSSYFSHYSVFRPLFIIHWYSTKSIHWTIYSTLSIIIALLNLIHFSTYNSHVPRSKTQIKAFVQQPNKSLNSQNWLFYEIMERNKFISKYQPYNIPIIIFQIIIHSVNYFLWKLIG